MNNNYWNNNGKYQKEYDEMMKAKHEFTKANKAIARRYYRYYNDGDMPRNTMFMSYEEIEEMLEEQVDEMLVKEYKRFNKNLTKKGGE